MRIYLSSGMSNILDHSKLIKRATTYTEIFSSDGIFRIQNKKMYRIIAQDKEIEDFTLNNLKLLVDKSEMTQNAVMTLPYNHQVREIEQVDYRFNSNSAVSLILLYHKKKVIDMYFLTKADKVSSIIKNDILEYITLLDMN